MRGDDARVGVGMGWDGRQRKCVLVALGRMRTWRRGLVDDAWEWRDGSLRRTRTERWLVKKELAFFSYRIGRQSVQIELGWERFVTLHNGTNWQKMVY